VTEEIGEQKGFGKRGAIDGDERPSRPRAAAMEAAGGELRISGAATASHPEPALEA